MKLPPVEALDCDALAEAVPEAEVGVDLASMWHIASEGFALHWAARVFAKSRMLP